MTTGKFNNEASLVRERLTHIHTHVNRTIEVLERLLNAEDEIEIREWAVRAGKIFITFASPVEIVNVPESEKHIQRTLTALFPSCRYSGTMVEVEASELL